MSDGIYNQTRDATDGQGPVGEDNADACLTAFAGGPAVEMAMALDQDERDRAFAGLYEQLYPGFSESLTASRYMGWPRHPWARASYSFPAPGQVTTVGPLLAMSHMSGRLHLAGEHACYKFVGYMEGALSSGVSVAREIALRDGVLKQT